MDTACNLHADGPHDAADAMQVACGVHATCSKKNAGCRGKVCWVHWLHLQVAFLKMQLARGASACCICASATCGHFTCRLQTLYLQVADVLSAGCRKVAGWPRRRLPWASHSAPVPTACMSSEAASDARRWPRTRTLALLADGLGAAPARSRLEHSKGSRSFPLPGCSRSDMKVSSRQSTRLLDTISEESGGMPTNTSPAHDDSLICA